MADYQKLQELLAKESYPHRYAFKVIGKNTPQFATGVSELVAAYPGLSEDGRRPSQTATHMSVTYSVLAETPEAIIGIYQQLALVPDVVMVL